MTGSSKRIHVTTWADFDEFWSELRTSHDKTPYAFDAFDEEVARIAFKAGRESMRRQVAAMLEHTLELQAAAAGRMAGFVASANEREEAMLRELVEEVGTLRPFEEN